MNNLVYLVRSKLLAMMFDVAIIPLAWFAAYYMRYNLGKIPHVYFLHALIALPLLIVIQGFFYWFFGLYRGVWRFASLPDLIRIIKAVFVASVVSLLIVFLWSRLHDMPRSIFPLYGILLILLLGGARLFYRYIKEQGRLGLARKRVLIVGAGQAGESLARDLLRHKGHYHVVGFIDDAKGKRGKEIHGIRVIGTCSDISNAVQKYEIDLIIIAIPAAKTADMQRIVALCSETHKPFQTLPGLQDLTLGRVSVNALREVALEDLLGREQVQVDWQSIQINICRKKVLISGGGGSIGSELCRQVASLNPEQLIVIEKSEFNLYKLSQEIKNHFPNVQFYAYLADITDGIRMKSLLQKIQPNIVFHAAAYKHVPILEDQVYAAVHNNVMGTKIFAAISEEVGVEKFVLISTDKAVNPTNVMGASKRAAEILCHDMNHKSKTKFITVRFGNVLGSSGSVIPLFEKQLAKGGPLTVTHPEITRFFMTIPEAARLIMQAGVIGRGGEIFVLDMGEPIKINYLAEQIIRLSGKEPGIDIEIIYSGLRPGEKLYEELFYGYEEMTRTENQKIFLARHSLNNREQRKDSLNELENMLAIDDSQKIMTTLKGLVPEFQGD